MGGLVSAPFVDVDTAAAIGLGNVDNVSDANKPVSSAGQTALDLKLDATAKAADSELLDGVNGADYARGYGVTHQHMGSYLTVKGDANWSVFEFERDTGVDVGTVYVDVANELLGMGVFHPSGSASGRKDLVLKYDGGITWDGNNVYHVGNKPLLSDIGFTGFETNDSHTVYSSDLNSIAINSIYNFDSGSVTNEPSGMTGWGFVHTMKHSAPGYFSQVLTTMNTAIVHMWIRQNNNGTWSAWSEVFTEANSSATKLWVNFNGEGTVAIRDSKGVSSITDEGTGRYLVNFSVAQPNANYAAPCSAGESTTTDARQCSARSYLTGSVGITVKTGGGTASDPLYCSLAVIGD